MKKIFWSVLFILVVIVTNAGALTWNEALSLAEQNSHVLESARKKVESSEWSYRKSYSTFLPQLSASAGMSETSSGTVSATGKSYSYGLSATQHLFRGMDGIYGIRSAYADLGYQKANLSSTRASIFFELRSSFIEVLITQKNVKLLEIILAQRRENTRLIQLRYDSGNEDKGNFMSTQADEAQAEYDLSSAGRELKLAKLKLSQLLRQDVASVEGQNELKAPESIDFNQLVNVTPSYLMNKKQLESAELAYKSTISGFLPSVSLSGSYRNTGSDWPPDRDSKSWSLNISYSFFPGGSNIADRAIYSAKLAQAEEDFANSVKDLRYNLEESFENFIDALEALKVSKTSLNATKERARISRAKYLNGLTNYDEWNRIENSYIQAQKSLLTQRKSALQAEALWHRIYGGWVQ
jgi:outer membrane protein TolC